MPLDSLITLSAFRYHVSLDENQQITENERLGWCYYVPYVVRGEVFLPARSTDRKFTNTFYNGKWWLPCEVGHRLLMGHQTSRTHRSQEMVPRLLELNKLYY